MEIRIRRRVQARRHRGRVAARTSCGVFGCVGASPAHAPLVQALARQRMASSEQGGRSGGPIDQRAPHCHSAAGCSFSTVWQCAMQLGAKIPFLGRPAMLPAPPRSSQRPHRVRPSFRAAALSDPRPQEGRSVRIHWGGAQLNTAVKHKLDGVCVWCVCGVCVCGVWCVCFVCVCVCVPHGVRRSRTF